MKYIKLVLEQPSANYGRNISLTPRLSYPIPPYSTVIGMFVNALGIKINTEDRYKQLQNIKLSIAGYYEGKRIDYSRHRILGGRKVDAKTHLKDKRSNPYLCLEHFGDTVPLEVEILYNVHLVLHIAHEDEDFLKILLNSLLEPNMSSNPLHLGRGEDMFIIRKYYEPRNIYDLKVKSKSGLFRSPKYSNMFYYFWIPEHIYLPEQYKQDFDFERVQMAPMKIGVFTYTVGYNTKTLKPTVDNRRVIHTMRVKLANRVQRNFIFLHDEEDNVPVFFADFTELSEIKIKR